MGGTILKMRNGLVGMLLGLVLVVTGCVHYQFRIIVQDNNDKPIPGAIVYVESYDHTGAKDFTWVTIGDSITVPPEDKSPIALGGSNETNITIVIFAKGKKPMVMYDPQGTFNPEMWEYMLEDDYGHQEWDPKFAQLEFPFVHQFDLQDRLKNEKNEPLVRAFLEAYKPLKDKIREQQASSDEINKYEVLRGKIYEAIKERKAEKKK
jgi:hypothetical protein